ncbi:MAG: hypothetical protein GY699_00195 [Desulfobacteraceae bacterium]|nr:hypothetical protein [Desulfobacteraceae bacterium]
MPFSSQKKSLGIILIFTPLVIAFAIAFYNSAKNPVKPYFRFKNKFRNVIDESLPSLPSDQVILEKDIKKIIGKTGLVFKGLSQGAIHIELYLLEFDSDMPYPKKFTKEAARDGIWIDNVQLQLVKVKENKLRLKILGVRELN